MAYVLSAKEEKEYGQTGSVKNSQECVKNFHKKSISNTAPRLENWKEL